MDFVVGDFITGIKGNGYYVTNEKNVMLVVEANERRLMVLTLTSYEDSYTVYNVVNDREVFTHISYDVFKNREDLISEFKELNIPNWSQLEHFPYAIICAVAGYNEEETRQYIKESFECKRFKNFDFFNKETGEIINPKEGVIMEGMESGTTIFNKNDEFKWTEEEITGVAETLEGILGEYEYAENCSYEPDINVLKEIVRTGNDNKGWIEATLSKHPAYDRETHTISVVKDFKRLADKGVINDFWDYLTERFCCWLIDNYKVEEPYSKKEYSYYYEEERKLSNIINCFDRFNNTGVSSDGQEHLRVSYKGLYFNHYNERLKEVRNKKRKYDEWVNLCCLYDYRTKKDIKINEEGRNELKKFNNFKNNLMNATDRISEAEARIINEEELCGYNEFCRAVEGQKTTTIVRKFAEHFGITEHKDLKEIKWTTQDGEEKTRTKDYGWNDKYRLYCDAITPKNKKMKMYVSLNTIDFYTESFGSGWASCQTIDKTNIRPNNGANHYEGCYSGATTDYAMDGSTIIVYLLPAEYEGNEPYIQDKIKRCLFYIGEDKIIQSRTYPDGRDGSDYTDMSKQLREYFEEILSECNTELGEWEAKSKNEISMRDEVECARGKLHYTDYFQYSDIYKITNKKVFPKGNKIIIGAKPVCITCGCTNDNPDYIVCNDCRIETDGDYCSECGELIRNRDDYIRIGDNMYCCDECAESAGAVYTENDGWQWQDDCFYDDYDGYWFYGDPDVCTEDGHDFASTYNAEQAGYIETEDGWYKEDDVFYCEHCERYVHYSKWDSDYDCCEDCREEVMAEEE